MRGAPRKAAILVEASAACKLGRPRRGSLSGWRRARAAAARAARSSRACAAAGASRGTRPRPRRAACGLAHPARRAVAPRAASSSMMSLEPRFAAPWIARRPMEFTASISLPSSAQSSTAASNAAGPSSKVWFTTQLTPAAAISGVVPANVAMLASAPCSSSKRMTVTSPASAARRNGVWPVKSTHDSEPRPVMKRRSGGYSRVRALGSAPRSSSSVMSSSAAARSMRLSRSGPLTSRLRTSTAAQSGVSPYQSAALTLAPRSMR